MTFLSIDDFADMDAANEPALVSMTPSDWEALVRGKGVAPAVDPATAPQPDAPPAANTERVMPARALQRQVQRIGVGR